MIEQNETINGCQLIKGFWKTEGDPLGIKLADIFPLLKLPRHSPAHRYIWSFRSENIHFYIAEETEQEAQRLYVEKVVECIAIKDVAEWERTVLRDELKKYESNL